MIILHYSSGHSLITQVLPNQSNFSVGKEMGLWNDKQSETCSVTGSEEGEKMGHKPGSLDTLDKLQKTRTLWRLQTSKTVQPWQHVDISPMRPV